MKVNKMFSKSKPAEPTTTSSATMPSPPDNSAKTQVKANSLIENSSAPKPKAAPSVLSSDLNIKGNLTTSGDIQIEGVLEGDIKAHLLTVGETATIKGEVIADDVVVNGRVIGCVRGLKVRLTSTARVEGDVIHKTIAIESGAHFEGSVKRNDDPLNNSTKKE
jgi:cytoskeletal protein CcmA (bactofilin family)